MVEYGFFNFNLFRITVYGGSGLFATEILWEIVTLCLGY